MNAFQIGNTHIIKKYLGFLVDKHHMNFSADALPNVSGVEHPTYVYSFYNEYGCYSLVEIAQRGEWDCYRADYFDIDPSKRLQTKISQRSYINHSVFCARTFLKLTATYIRNEIVQTNSFWGIQV